MCVIVHHKISQQSPNPSDFHYRDCFICLLYKQTRKRERGRERDREREKTMDSVLIVNTEETRMCSWMCRCAAG